MTSQEFWGENVVSKNSLKTGMFDRLTRMLILTTTQGRKHGRRSKASIDAKKEKRAGAISDSRMKAEENWGAYCDASKRTHPNCFPESFVITAIPGELIKCKNGRDAMESKLTKFSMDHEGYERVVGKCHIPCPPLAFDASVEKAFLLDISRHPILCGIKPSFLLHKFENVVTENDRLDLLRRWTDFKLMSPMPHKSPISRSTDTESYHLGIWRKREKMPFITADTRCGEDLQQARCKDFLRLVKKSIAFKIRSLLKKYAPEEWAEREV